MPVKVTMQLAWLCVFTLSLAIYPALLQKPSKRRTVNGNTQLKMTGCCDEIRELKLQIANVSAMLGELSKKQEVGYMIVDMQVMELKGSTQQMESRLIDVESKYSEINSQIDNMQLQAAQTVTQTSADAVYDCSSLYQKNYRISGVYKLPPDEFLGSPEIEVYCDMETEGGGWTIIQRRKVGLISFNRDWKQYKEGFGNIRGDFWLGNENVYRLSRRPTMLRVELEDWEGNTRYAQYDQFTLSNELNSYRLFLGNYTGNTGRDSLRYHNNTAFSTKDKDNDKCVDHCAELRKGGYWYNCCTDSNLNGVYYRKGEHTKNMDGITWYGWHGSTYSLKRVEMKIRPEDFKP
ncbi:angiopoietin-related protein 7 isoform X2 [Pelodiscus sinensis]|uniref:angiopoietin-related protein 7 isoform X2 n=1 Tax=Pelodiscus sinensis TaxID=13735 RepID=UPI0003C4303D|nr:angiopoietin-related protein 7 isoform X2 [Pelodiscus sinensis]|eukprot:XP_006127101.1 angiopoietin-related protein 7 isoform X2 [Pelodiscus sinensis]